MNEQGESAYSAKQPPASSGVHMSAGGNQSVRDSIVAGRDVNQHNETKKRNIRIGIGGAVIALLLGGGYWAYHGLTSSDTGAVYESGLQGATDTMGQLRQAELDQNADNWCFTASATSGDTCRSLMANSFSATNSRRSTLSDYTFGPATGNASQAQVPVLAGDRQVGAVALDWTGSRWELNSAMYLLAINNGGLLMTAEENASGCGAVFGVVTGCH